MNQSFTSSAWRALRPQSFLLLALLAGIAQGAPQGTTFTYQGRLGDGGGAASGAYDFQMALFDAASGGGQVGATLDLASVPVRNGLFTVSLDFGANAFQGEARWLGVAVRAGGTAGAFIPLSPRQPLSAAPYALYAMTPAGPKGEKGDVGPQGPSGSAGATGATGATGPQGAVGPIGPSGAQGLTGPQGSVGPAGATGPQGIPGSTDAWSRTGNAGTSAGANFLGTSDDQPLEFKVNGVRVLRLEPNAISPNVIGGHSDNRAGLTGEAAIGATVFGGGAAGFRNVVLEKYGTISGGAANFSWGAGATIGGGFENDIGILAGGVGGDYNTISGGRGNRAWAESSTIGGGADNSVGGDYGTVAGGESNASLSHGTVGGGEGNGSSGSHATVPGGKHNAAVGNLSFAAGYRARALHDGTFVWADSTDADFASTSPNQFLIRASGGVRIFTTGGAGMTIDNQPVLSGPVGPAQLADSAVSTTKLADSAVTTPRLADGSVTATKLADGAVTAAKIGGSQVVKSLNSLQDDVSLVAGANVSITPSGGNSLQISAAGGWGLAGTSGTTPGANFLGTADDQALELKVNNTRALRLEPGASPNLIGGFSGNSASAGAVGVAIGGGGQLGSENSVTGDFGVVGGGSQNTATLVATVSGGAANDATGFRSTVGGGFFNVASGFASTIAGGQLNTATGDFSFAAGQHAKADHSGSFVWADSSVSDEFHSQFQNQFRVRAYNGTRFDDGVSLWVEMNRLASKPIDTATTAYLSGGGTWVNASDVARKEHFRAVNPQTILEQVSQLPISTWNYRQENEAISHLGPTAQDFYAAFHLGQDDKHIATVDEGGVALAAIQGLHALVREQEGQIQSLQAGNSSMRKQLVGLQNQIAAQQEASAQWEARFSALKKIVATRHAPPGQPALTASRSQTDEP